MRSIFCMSLKTCPLLKVELDKVLARQLSKTGLVLKLWLLVGLGD
ncbi:hypothetical protein FAIPA1_320053 [Frankia sp. AiPs1]